MLFDKFDFESMECDDAAGEEISSSCTAPPPNSETIFESPPPMDRGVCDLDPAAPPLPIGEKLDAADKDIGLTVLDSGETVRGDEGGTVTLSTFVSDSEPMFPILAAAGFFPAAVLLLGAVS